MNELEGGSFSKLRSTKEGNLKQKFELQRR